MPNKSSYCINFLQINMLSDNPNVDQEEHLTLPDLEQEQPDEADSTLWTDDLQLDDTPFYANQMQDPEVYYQYQAYLDECYENWSNKRTCKLYEDQH